MRAACQPLPKFTSTMPFALKRRLLPVGAGEAKFTVCAPST
jgi:hypothetical protein